MPVCVFIAPKVLNIFAFSAIVYGFRWHLQKISFIPPYQSPLLLCRRIGSPENIRKTRGSDIDGKSLRRDILTAGITRSGVSVKTGIIGNGTILPKSWPPPCVRELLKIIIFLSLPRSDASTRPLSHAHDEWPMRDSNQGHIHRPSPYRPVTYRKTNRGHRHGPDKC